MDKHSPDARVCNFESRRQRGGAIGLFLSVSVAALVAQGTVAFAQTSGATQLPPLSVETQKARPKAKAQAKRRTPPARPRPQVAQPAPGPSPAAEAGAGSGPATATSPVRDYNPQNTATGIKTDTPLREIPQSISVVGREQMRDQGAQTVSEALRYVPGVVAESHGPDSRTDGSFIRGTAPVEYLDGMRRNFDTFYYGYRVDPYFMERIEVLRGPASVLYGQAPVGGIVNAVSKRPGETAGGEIGVDYGSFNYKQVRFDTTGLITTDGRWTYRLTGLARDAGTQTNHVPDDRFTIQPSITWRPDADTTVTLLGYFQKDRSGSIQQILPRVGTLLPNVNGRRISRKTFIGEPGDYYDTDVAAGTLFVEHALAPWLKLNHTSRYADSENRYDNKYPALWGYLDAAQEEILRARAVSDTHTQVFNQDTSLQATFATGPVEHRLLGGFDYAHFRANRANTDYLQDITQPDYLFNVFNPRYGNNNWMPSPLGCSSVCTTKQTIEQAGLYLQDQIRLGSWIAVLGLRHDWVDNKTLTSTQKSEATTYRAGLMYEFDFGLTPYVSFAESFVPVPGVNDNGRAFVPQTGRQYEIGFKYQPVGTAFAINASVFDIEETGRVVAGFVPGTQRQLAGIAVQGFEIEATGRLTRNLKITGGYSYTKAEYDDKVDKPHNGRQVESVPKHLASLWGVWEFDQPQLNGWSIGGGVRYIGENWTEKLGASTVVVEVPSVTLFDAMISYETDTWRWQLVGRNLEDKYYVSTCLNRGDCWLGSARTITTSLTYKF